MKGKKITVVFYGRHYPRDDWKYDVDNEAVAKFFSGLKEELAPFEIELDYLEDDNITLKINGYGDLLNSVRLRSPRDGFGNLCLGHVIIESPNADLFEDLERAINRLAFAPEMIQPEDHNRTVCHNCGCGC